ncbi:myeloid-associated differentiation marker-like [Echeneis naucrates]|uniref:Myeloid-associated differentiation marker-like n=1 Tax=Echeneis naucrates TaxID=173247 RepID=A0A665UHC1_ECHNA|nr:myeloid-associated differentiation marker-like [Echeneis naucrates]
MAYVGLRSLTQPVGIMRILAVIVTCMSFVLVATVGPKTSSYWAWCMFTWVFCFVSTLLILILEFANIHIKVLFAWDDITVAFAILASLMCFSTSIIYPTLFTCNTCHLEIGASVVSWLCFGAYASEVALRFLRPSGQSNGFLSTLPGIMKLLETFIACLIFTSLETSQYFNFPGLQWCVAVYSLCFSICIIIILLSIGQMSSSFPFSYDKLVTFYNILAAVLYGTTMVIWPLYSLSKSNCGHQCSKDKRMVVTFMTIFNFIVYTLDTIYSIRLVFFVNRETSQN